MASPRPPQTLPFNFITAGTKLGEVVKALGELLINVWMKAEDKIRGSELGLDKAVANAIKFLESISTLPKAKLTELKILSKALATADIPGDSVPVGLTARKLLKIYGDVLEEVLGAAAAPSVVPGLGLDLKNVCYQLSSLVHQDFGSAWKSLKELLLRMLLGDGVIQSFDKHLSDLNTKASAVSQDYNALQAVFFHFSHVLNHVFREVQKRSEGTYPISEVENGNVPQVLPPKEYNFEQISRPFGLVVSKLGEFLNAFRRKAEANQRAGVLKKAVNYLIEKLAGIGIVPPATLTQFGRLSDELVTAVTSGDAVGVRITALKLLYIYGDVLETVLGAISSQREVPMVGLALKDICYQLGSLVDQTFAGAGKAVTAFLQPTDLGEGTLKKFDSKLSDLNTKTLTTLQDFDQSVLTDFSPVIIGVFEKVGLATIKNSLPNDSPPQNPGTGKVDIKPVAKPFAAVLEKVGELLHNMLKTGGRDQISTAASALDTAVHLFIDLLRKLAIISSANLDAAASLSAALVRKASSTSVDGVSTAIFELLNKLAEITGELFGSAHKSVSRALKSIVIQLAGVVKGIVEPLMKASPGLQAGLLLPNLLPHGTEVSRAAGFVTNSLEPEIKPLGLQNATPLSNALYKLRGDINNTDAGNVGLALQEVFYALAPIYRGVITGIGSKGGVNT